MRYVTERYVSTRSQLSLGDLLEDPAVCGEKPQKARNLISEALAVTGAASSHYSEGLLRVVVVF
jgi:hypothetical protein